MLVPMFRYLQQAILPFDIMQLIMALFGFIDDKGSTKMQQLNSLGSFWSKVVVQLFLRVRSVLGESKNGFLISDHMDSSFRPKVGSHDGVRQDISRFAQ